MARKGLAKAKRCLKLKQQGKVAAARRAGCTWPSRSRGVSGTRKRRKRKRRTRALRGHVRTCIQYKCVKGRGEKHEDAACKKGWVLRCAQYVDDSGIPRTVKTRKDYQEFTYGRYHRGEPGARSLFPPKMSAARLKPIHKRKRGVPRGAVRPGPGRR
jgi:hypothetical protein